jgi:hypothetical protein
VIPASAAQTRIDRCIQLAAKRRHIALCELDLAVGAAAHVRNTVLGHQPPHGGVFVKSIPSINRDNAVDRVALRICSAITSAVLGNPSFGVYSRAYVESWRLTHG